MASKLSPSAARDRGGEESGVTGRLEKEKRGRAGRLDRGGLEREGGKQK